MVYIIALIVLNSCFRMLLLYSPFVQLKIDSPNHFKDNFRDRKLHQIILYIYIHTHTHTYICIISNSFMIYVFASNFYWIQNIDNVSLFLNYQSFP